MIHSPPSALNLLDNSLPVPLPNHEAKNKLAFALDVPNRKEAVRFIQTLEEYVGCFKVGLELFIREGPDILKAVREHSSADIFLDLKLHDIPATVRGALVSDSQHGAKYITDHTSGGREMLQTAKEVESQGLEVLAVTVLTSLDQKELVALGYREEMSLKQLVLEKAALAEKSGCRGVVCSGNELKTVKQQFGNRLKLVVPGIRPKWGGFEGDDQSRITTPAQAIKDGADLLVVGRPIRNAKNPKEAAEKILQEIASAC